MFEGLFNTDVPHVQGYKRLMEYGHWLLLAGRITEARKALQKAKEASPVPDDGSSNYGELHGIQINTPLLQVIESLIPTEP